MPLNVSGFRTFSLSAFFCFLCQAIDNRYPAVFNFGDSNSDTGGLLAGVAFPVVPPNGQTYFREPHGRFCDGRLVIDFLVNAWGLPFLNPYLDSVGAPNFKNGCNFATAGSTILRASASSITVSPFTFGIQVDQFITFKAKVLELLLDKGASRSRGFLPQKEYFAQGLYTIDMGLNDLVIALREKHLDASIPVILSELQTGIKKLYNEGARKFWIHNVGPMGCLPSIISLYGKDSLKLDKSGCAKQPNKAAKRFNSQLKAFCTSFRRQFLDVDLTYINIFKIKSNLISKYSKYGFEQPIAACCGFGGLPLNYNRSIPCGYSQVLNGRIEKAVACANPAEYIIWDGNHQTEAANLLVSLKILTGRFSDRLLLT